MIPSEPPLVLSWPSSGRRACLAESAAGFVENARRHGREATFLISTDLGWPELDPGLRAGLEAQGWREGEVGPFRILDRRARLDLIEGLKADFDPELLRYALFPHPDGQGWGCNVNASLLASAGSFLVSCDDDIFCEPVRRSGASATGVDAGPVCDPAADPARALYSEDFSVSEPRWFRNREELLGAVEPTEVDVIGAYRAFLGRTRLEIFGKDDAGLGGRASGAGSPILLVNPGTYGDSGMGAARSVLCLEGESREALMADYEGLKLSREVLRVAPSPVVSPSSQLLMTQTGLDNRIPLPPLLTYGRNSDGLFAVLLRLVYPGSLSAYLDFGFLHSPPEPRTSSYEGLVGFRPGLAELVMAAALVVRPSAPDPVGRYRGLGKALTDLAALPDPGFAEAVHAAWSSGVESYARLLSNSLDRYGREPASWTCDVEAHLAAIEAACSEPRAAFGSGGCGLDPGQARRHFDLYGRLLGIWPALHAKMALSG